MPNVDSLPRIKPHATELIPPEGAKPVGVHSDGRVIYEMEIPDLTRIAKNKVHVTDPETGEPLYKKHPNTGEKMYPILKSVPFFRKQRFVLNRDGHGNVYKHENFEPTPEEISHLAKLREKREFSERLADLAVERGISADELVLRMLGVSDTVSNKPGEVTIKVPEEELEYPHYRGGGHWTLSDGSSFRGSRDAAMAAESTLMARATVGMLDLEAGGDDVMEESTGEE